MYPTKPIEDKRVSGWALEYTDLPIMDERTLRVQPRTPWRARRSITNRCPDCGRLDPLECGRSVCDYLDSGEG